MFASIFYLNSKKLELLNLKDISNHAKTKSAEQRLITLQLRIELDGTYGTA